MSAQYLATTIQSGQYVVLLDNNVVTGPFPSAVEVVRARDALIEAGRVVVGDMSSERVANT